MPFSFMKREFIYRRKNVESKCESQVQNPRVWCERPSSTVLCPFTVISEEINEML